MHLRTSAEDLQTPGVLQGRVPNRAPRPLPRGLYKKQRISPCDSEPSPSGGSLQPSGRSPASQGCPDPPHFAFPVCTHSLLPKALLSLLYLPVLFSCTALLADFLVTFWVSAGRHLQEAFLDSLCSCLFLSIPWEPMEALLSGIFSWEAGYFVE